jgi:phospholipase C
MTVGLNSLKHLVVLMTENRSFDHMLGGLSLVIENERKKYPGVNGLTGIFEILPPSGAGKLVYTPLGSGSGK